MVVNWFLQQVMSDAGSGRRCLVVDTCFLYSYVTLQTSICSETVSDVPVFPPNL